VQNRWNEAEAAQFPGEVGQLVYVSRLFGQDFDLTQYGGGNTSVKRTEADLFGVQCQMMVVKGSGYDLSTITEAGFAPVVLSDMTRLLSLDAMGDGEMMNAMMCARTRADAPAPSVEAILHAALPYKYVLHAHVTAVMALTGVADADAEVERVYGDSLVVVPYVMPGFKLAKLGYQCWLEVVSARPADGELLPADTDGKIGMIWMKHGLVSWGDSAREAYDRLIMLADHAEEWVTRRSVGPVPPLPTPSSSQRVEVAQLRHDLSRAAGAPVIVRRSADPQASGFAGHERVADWSQRGGLTPDHVIRTKRVPMLGRDVATYADAYRAYFERNAPRSVQPLTMLDPAPRIILDPALGMLSVGRLPRDAVLAGAFYERTVAAILGAESVGGWDPPGEADAFDVEYWELEQARLRRQTSVKPFTGEIALVTGAASGIGKACVEALRGQGAAVVALDINPAVVDLFTGDDALGLVCDLTDESALSGALDAAIDRFGGLDMLVLNAGLFPSSARIADLSDSTWRRVMDINLDANLALMRAAHPLLKLAPGGGRVVVVGSKNVPAPGPGAAAYSASKAALNQLARVAALEWGADGIRVNSVHPNQVFDTALWTDDLIAARAKHYGLSVEAYKTNNVLRTEVTSRDVAASVVALLSDVFRVTTGAQVPVDGGNDRVI
jgi:rhamnose utilization protein RhaD (predicted bifunctional aldolase and dehydrogenase)/NAD(P)-dependent dehydrogenase (short-subunit alcohol dehydrogenase family)